MTYPPLFLSVFVCLFGAVIGSFLNVCIHRLPREESIAFPPSHCPACGSRIAPWDNIPVISWLLLKGRCRSCGNRISLQYPIVETINALLSLALFLHFGLSGQFALYLLFSSALVVITFIDLEHQIIPDVISLPGIVIGFAASFFTGGIGWLNSLTGIAIGGGSLLLIAWVYELATKKEGMGGGDIKLLAMMGAFLGWRSVPFIIFAASLVGSVIGITLMLIQKKDGKLAIPFGPFLAFGAMLYLFYGGRIIDWYLSLGTLPQR